MIHACSKCSFSELWMAFLTCGAEVHDGALFECVPIHHGHVHGVVDGPDHQLVLGEGQEVLQDAEVSDRVENWLDYKIAGKGNCNFLQFM